MVVHQRGDIRHFSEDVHYLGVVVYVMLQHRNQRIVESEAGRPVAYPQLLWNDDGFAQLDLVDEDFNGDVHNLDISHYLDYALEFLTKHVLE